MMLFFFMCINNSVNCQDYVESVMNEWVWSINGVTVTGHIPGIQVICKQLTAWTMMWAHVLLLSPRYASCVLLPNISTLKYVKCNFDYCVIRVWYMRYWLSRTWISNLWPATLYYVAYSRVTKLCVYYKNYTII